MKAQDLAHAIVDYALHTGRPVSNMILQILMFFCALSHYKQGLGRLIDDEAFEAWDYTPVIREIYIEFSIFGASRIIKRFDNTVPLPSHLQLTLDKWLPRGPWELAGRVHIANGAWQRSYNRTPKNIIPESYIQEEALTYDI
ncbi:MAG: hypothetical protein IAB19_01210 [Proteobacteria bacterium]|uniref:Antitoxin SocA-like Panacea domain-containing protein n=1 Tax=Candidatus Avisuccinivibrio stercorigallinarum TaxID=2840704 RepID=A0A9D9D864_9GAMM|nr:hypothetical protein [Candidatus Avisuccinivibrio stercorigallinarum]